MSVGERMSCARAGSDPLQSGPAMTKSAALTPVVRAPGVANTLVHASSIGIK